MRSRSTTTAATSAAFLGSEVCPASPTVSGRLDDAEVADVPAPAAVDLILIRRPRCRVSRRDTHCNEDGDKLEAARHTLFHPVSACRCPERSACSRTHIVAVCNNRDLLRDVAEAVDASKDGASLRLIATPIGL
jgi:hypothetical protein